MSQKDKCGEAEEMQSGAVRTFEAQSPRKRTMTSIFTGGAQEALPRMGLSDALRVSFHTSILLRGGSGISNERSWTNENQDESWANSRQGAKASGR